MRKFGARRASVRLDAADGRRYLPPRPAAGGAQTFSPGHDSGAAPRRPSAAPDDLSIQGDAGGVESGWPNSCDRRGSSVQVAVLVSWLKSFESGS